MPIEPVLIRTLLLQSHLAMQSSLPQDLVPLGASTLLSIISTSCAIFMAIGQAVFQKQLQNNLQDVLPQDTVTKIIDSGVTDLSSLVESSVLSETIAGYSLSVTQIFVSLSLSGLVGPVLVIMICNTHVFCP